MGKALCNKIPGCPANGFSYVKAWRQCRLPKANAPCKADHYRQGAFYRHLTVGECKRQQKKHAHAKAAAVTAQKHQKKSCGKATARTANAQAKATKKHKGAKAVTKIKAQ